MVSGSLNTKSSRQSLQASKAKGALEPAVLNTLTNALVKQLQITPSLHTALDLATGHRQHGRQRSSELVWVEIQGWFCLGSPQDRVQDASRPRRSPIYSTAHEEVTFPNFSLKSGAVLHITSPRHS